MIRPRMRDGFLPWLYYWLDLYGPDGRPANGKVMSAFGLGCGLAMVALWGWRLSQKDQGLTWPFWAVLATVLALVAGVDGIKTALKIRSGGGGGEGGMRLQQSSGLQVQMDYTPPRTDNTADELLPGVAQSRPTDEP